MPLVFALTESLNTSLTEVYSNRAEAKNQETMSIFYLKAVPNIYENKSFLCLKNYSNLRLLKHYALLGLDTYHRFILTP